MEHTAVAGSTRLQVKTFQTTIKFSNTIAICKY